MSSEKNYYLDKTYNFDFLKKEIENICDKLSKFWKKTDLNPKQIFSNVEQIFQNKNENGIFVDELWMEHISSSIRELINVKFINECLLSSLNSPKIYGSIEAKKLLEKLGKYYIFFSSLTHLNKEEAINIANDNFFSDKKIENINEEIFYDLCSEFIQFFSSFLNFKEYIPHIKLHTKVDELFSKSPEKFGKKYIWNLINENYEIHNYFYANVPIKKWFKWLFNENFIVLTKENRLKSKKNINLHSELEHCYIQLDYLIKVVKEQKYILKIIEFIFKQELSFKPDYLFFSSKIILKFLKIILSLPSNGINEGIFNEIKKRNWIARILENKDFFLNLDLEISSKIIFQKLFKYKKYREFLIFFDDILKIKFLKECDKENFLSPEIKKFPFEESLYIEIFSNLVKFESEYAEEALKIIFNKISTFIISEKNEIKSENSIFKISDFHFKDVDFFKLKVGFHYGFLFSVPKVLFFTFINLFQKLIQNSENTKFITEIYEKYVKKLPDSNTIWRLKLFILSIRPDVFKEELKCSFSRLFKAIKNDLFFSEIISGTEYKKCLKKTFHIFDEKFHRNFVKKIFEFFGKLLLIKTNNENHKFYKYCGWEILSSICNFLTQKEKNDCKKIFGKKCDIKFTPKPIMSEIKIENYFPKGVISNEQIEKWSVSKFVDKLKIWNSKEFKKIKNNFGPKSVNVDGVAAQLEKDIFKRPEEYIANANLFFDKELETVYISTFFNGILRTIKNEDFINYAFFDWEELINLISKIIELKKTNSTENKIDLHPILDLVGFFLKDYKDEKKQEYFFNNKNFEKFRKKIFNIIECLFEIFNLIPEIKMSKENLLNQSLNSFVGKSFQLLVYFIFREEKQFLKNKLPIIKNKYKALYEKLLKETNSENLMFVFGFYFNFFYLRDKNWIGKLLINLFSKKKNKKHLLIAFLDGFFSQSKIILKDNKFQEIYEWIFKIKKIENLYSYKTEINKRIAQHFVIFFLHEDENFNFEKKLFKNFWKGNLEQQKEFISFIGSNLVTKKNENFFKSQKIKKHLTNLWKYVLKEKNNSEIFQCFGFWTDPNKKIMNPKEFVEIILQTLKKAKGILKYPYLFMENINFFVKSEPKKTLEIIRLFLFKSVISGKVYFYKYEEKWFNVLKILCEKKETKESTIKLIDELVRDGGQQFWKLKEIIQN